MNKYEGNQKVCIRRALTGRLPGEAPLLEELGVDFTSIKRDSLRVFFIKTEAPAESNDIIGPSLFLMLYGGILAIRGRVQPTYIYFLFTLSCLFVYGASSMMCTSGGISFLGVVNSLGCSFIPACVFAVLSTVISVNKKISLFGGMVFAFWCTFSATAEIISRYPMQNRAVLVGYPILLVYICFIIIAVA